MKLLKQLVQPLLLLAAALFSNGNLAQRTGRSLNTDPANGHIRGDPEAAKLWTRYYAPGW